MSAKNFLLGLLAIPLTGVMVNGTSTNLLGSSRIANLQDQTVLQSLDSPPVPEMKTMESDGVSRSYGISIPIDYDSAKKWPLIVDFHGRNGSALGQWNNSQYYLNELGKHFIVVYPEGCFGAGSSKGGPPERAWQGAPYANVSCNDILFVSNLVNQTQTNYNIDSTRIYASGKSNGGGFVDTLACSPTGNIFAAFAMAAAALYTDYPVTPDLCTVNPNRPRMILESHGTEDDVIPISGSVRRKLPNISRWVGRWAVRNGCAGKDPSLTTKSWGLNTTYSCKSLNNVLSVVQQYRVNGLGHCWPSLTNNTDTPHHNGTCLVQTLDFTSAVLKFFTQW